MPMCDWSSDVCSSDLILPWPNRPRTWSINYKVPLGIKQLLAFIFSFWSHLQIKCSLKVRIKIGNKNTLKHASICVCVHAKLLQALCDSVGCSPPGSSVLGILQARVRDKPVLGVSVLLLACCTGHQGLQFFQDIHSDFHVILVQHGLQR